MSTFTTVEALRVAAYGLTLPTGPEADAQLQALLDKAELRLVSLVPSIPDRVAAGTLAPELVAGVVQDMALRVLRNPTGMRQTSVSVDDYTEAGTMDTSLSSGLLYVSEGELALLAPAQSARGAFGSIRVARTGWWLR